MVACAGATILAGALSASPALASVTCDPIYGSGSSLQADAQGTQSSPPGTLGGGTGVYLNNWAGANTSCSSTPTALYSATSSGSGQNVFGDNTGTLAPTKDPNVPAGDIDAYAGTDDPPNAFQLGNAQSAAQEGTLVQITIPIAQAPVAVALSLPDLYTITPLAPATVARVSISNSQLNELWLGTVPAGGSDPHNGGAAYPAQTWGAFFALIGESAHAVVTDNGTGAGNGGETPINLEARDANSGTSYAFKSYLSQIDSTDWSPYASDFQFWPTTVTFNKTALVATGFQNDTGGHLAANTAATPGAVTYANTADAITLPAGATGFSGQANLVTDYGSASHDILFALIQNNGTSGSPTYAAPVRTPAVNGNCSTTKVAPGLLGAPYSYTDSWYGVLASDPNASTDLGATFYPICALTYDMTWKHYGAPGLAPFYNNEGASGVQNVFNSVDDYFTYLIGQGQTDINSDYYAAVPTPLHAKLVSAVGGMNSSG